MSWSCQDTARALADEDSLSLSASAFAQHLEDCSKCTLLLEVEFAQAEIDLNAEPLPDATWESLNQELAQEGTWTRKWRSLSTSKAAFGAALLAALPLCMQASLSIRPDAAAYPSWRWAIDSTTLGLTLVALLVLLLWPLQRLRSAPFAKANSLGWLLAATLGLALPLLLALSGPAHLAHAASLPVAPEDFWARARGCFLFGSALAAPLGAFLLLTSRRQSPSPLRLATLAAVLGALGNWILAIHCPLTSVGHLLLGHATIGFAFSLLLLASAWKLGKKSSAGPGDKSPQ